MRILAPPAAAGGAAAERPNAARTCREIPGVHVGRMAARSGGWPPGAAMARPRQPILTHFTSTASLFGQLAVGRHLHVAVVTRDADQPAVFGMAGDDDRMAFDPPQSSRGYRAAARIPALRPMATDAVLHQHRPDLLFEELFGLARRFWAGQPGMPPATSHQCHEASSTAPRTASLAR